MKGSPDFPGRRVDEALAGLEAKAPLKPTEITDESLNDELNRYRVIVIDFWADWCGPCRMIEPIIQELAKEYCGKIAFGKVNVDENPRAASRYGVMSIPTVIIFVDGQVVDKVVGAAPKNTIVSKINRALISRGL